MAIGGQQDNSELNARCESVRDLSAFCNLGSMAIKGDEMQETRKTRLSVQVIARLQEKKFVASTGE